MGGLYTNVEISGHMKRCLEDYLTSTGIPPGSFKGRIADSDEMYHKAIVPKHATDAYFKYIESGIRTHYVMQQFYQNLFNGPSNIGSMLEFASGHGRATRFIVQSISPEQVWASDIYTDAMDFQKSYFKVNTLQSFDDPEKLRCDLKFSLITAMSLFTHLPERLFGKWLERLASLLEDDGVLLVTVREARTAPRARNLDGIDDTGILFEHRSESSSLSSEIYGLTTVTDEFVRRMISEFISPEANVLSFERGLYLNQYVYAISRRSLSDFPSFELKRPPAGGRAPNWTTARSGDEIQIGGWAVDLNSRRKIVAVDVAVDNEIIAQAEFRPFRNKDFEVHFPNLESEPISWTVALPRRMVRPESIVKFLVRSETGASIEYYAPPVD